MDIFDKIDEFESKVSDQIKDKLSLFTKIMTDTDMYEKLILNQGNNEEVTPDKKDIYSWWSYMRNARAMVKLRIKKKYS